MSEKYYEVVLCRIAWHSVKAENAKEAEEIAKANEELEDYEECDGFPYYVTEEISKERAEIYDKILNNE